MASVDELEARCEEIRGELRSIDAEYAGNTFPTEAKERWNGLNEELETLSGTLAELHARRDRLVDLSGEEKHKEYVIEPTSRGGSRKASRVPDNIWDLSAYRNLSATEDEQGRALRDGAMRAIEGSSFPNPKVNREDAQTQVARFLDTIDTKARELARMTLATGSPAYHREFGHYLSTGQPGPEMQRAASLTTTAGGFAIPIILDPTVIPTSAGVINPLRQVARVETIVGGWDWKGVSTTGVTAAYAAEATENSDGAPVFAQPEAKVAKAQAFIPFSIEIGEDWGGFQGEMARLLQDAKDVLESTQFLTGTGTNAPEGLQVGATAVFTTAATATFAVADLYKLETTLSPRFRARATIIANKTQLNKVRQFDSYGGASLWVQLGDGLPPRLLDYPTYEYSAMDSSSTTGAWIVTMGDFNQFLILDRIGMSVEVIPHLFGTASNYPTGQRGLYCYWRNTSKVLAGGLSANSAFQTMKLL